MVIIPNAFDLENFRPDPPARQSVRQELGLSPEAPLIGLINRFHPMKDHNNFIQAATLLLKSLPEAHFLLCGGGVTWENSELVGWIKAGNLQERCHLLGHRDDIPRLMAALDIVSLSSSGGEGFPNVIGEAMACGSPCVVTDVGDAALIVGETGVVVPKKDPQALAAGWHKLLLDLTREERVQLGLAARRRVTEQYSLNMITQQYQRVYASMVKTG
jgi:glycosyltransferase involved in cell wall biosynthesis